MNPIKQKTTELLDFFRVKNPSSQYEQKLSHYIPLKWGHTQWIGAADPYSFILVPETDDNKVLHPEKNVVNLKNILPDKVLYQADIDKEKLIQLFKSIPLIETAEKKECPSCNGGGEFEHWGDTYDCQYCQETGEISTRHKIKIRDPKFTFAIDGNMVNPEKIEKLIIAITLSEAENVRYMLTSGNEAVVLFSLDYQIIVGLARYLPLKTDVQIFDISTECMSIEDLQKIKIIRP
jgi:hypothetical protein